MSQVIGDAHEPDEIERTFEFAKPIDRKFTEEGRVVKLEVTSRPAGLRKISSVDIDAEYFRSACCECKTVESRIATDVEDAPAGQIGGNTMPDATPFASRKIAERMLRGCLDAARQVQVVKPVAELC
jgi:hypothetical protein